MKKKQVFNFIEHLNKEGWIDFFSLELQQNEKKRKMLIEHEYAKFNNKTKSKK